MVLAGAKAVVTVEAVVAMGVWEGDVKGVAQMGAVVSVGEA